MEDPAKANESDLDNFISRVSWYSCVIQNNESITVFGIDFTADVSRVSDYISVAILEHETSIQEKINIPAKNFQQINIANLVRTTLKQMLVL